MCGIICVITTDKNHPITEVTEVINNSLKRRGPDFFNSVTTSINSEWNGYFASSVLHTQGKELMKQPIISANENILLWNGDIFGGDLVFEKNKFISDTCVFMNWLEKNEKDVLNVVTKIEGPYSFVYFDRKKNYLWVGRDPLGRHSLLWKFSDEYILITSVGHKSILNLMEIPAIGIFCFQFNGNMLSDVCLYRWAHCDESSFTNLLLHNKIKISSIAINYFNFNKSWLNTDVPSEQFFMCKNIHTKNALDIMNELLNNREIRICVDKFLDLLIKSVEKRVIIKKNVCKNCSKENDCESKHVKLGILFSGGLDSTVIACLADKFTNDGEPIDLLNVAFDRNGSFNTPDRNTAVLSLNELRALNPSRSWNLVEINVTNKELDDARQNHICHLIWPLDSVLDDSLGCALWFACRGNGVVANSRYKSTAKILLLGTGADEQLGGYMRHRNLLKRNNWQELGKQLLKETIDISKRNLGRDDRVANDNSSQPRFPFLDESLVKYVVDLPPWQRCDPVSFEPGVGDKLILRLAAVKLGLKQCAAFPKRAFQFGCRIAKSKEKGDSRSERL